MESVCSAQVLQTILGQCSAIFIISLIPFYIKEAHKTEGAQIDDIWNKSSPQSKTLFSLFSWRGSHKASLQTLEAFSTRPSIQKGFCCYFFQLDWLFPSARKVIISDNSTSSKGALCQYWHFSEVKKSCG